MATTRTMQPRGDAPARPDRAALGWALGLPMLRIALVAIASTLVWLIAGAQPEAFPPSPLLSAVAMLPVNIWYAPTPDAVLIFLCCFTVWGLISGLIYRWQRRLMPLVFAHFLVNLAFTLPALFIPFMIGA